MRNNKDKKQKKAVDRQLPEEETAHLEKPLLIWDGACGFCHYWVVRWKGMTGDALEYKPFQKVAGRFPSIPESSFRSAAFLIEPDGAVYRGMGAAYRTFTYGSSWAFLFRIYESAPIFRRFSNRLYSWIARHRPLLFRLTKLLWGKDPLNPKLYWLAYLLALALGCFLAVNLL